MWLSITMEAYVLGVYISRQNYVGDAFWVFPLVVSFAVLGLICINHCQVYEKENAGG